MCRPRILFPSCPPPALSPRFAGAGEWGGRFPAVPECRGRPVTESHESVTKREQCFALTCKSFCVYCNIALYVLWGGNIDSSARIFGCPSGCSSFLQTSMVYVGEPWRGELGCCEPFPITPKPHKIRGQVCVWELYGGVHVPPRNMRGHIKGRTWAKKICPSGPGENELIPIWMRLKMHRWPRYIDGEEEDRGQDGGLAKFGEQGTLGTLSYTAQPYTSLPEWTFEGGLPGVVIVGTSHEEKCWGETMFSFQWLYQWLNHAGLNNLQLREIKFNHFVEEQAVFPTTSEWQRKNSRQKKPPNL